MSHKTSKRIGTDLFGEDVHIQVVKELPPAAPAAPATPVSIPLMNCMSIKPTYTVLFQRRADQKPFNRKHSEMPKRAALDGVLRQRSAKRMRDSINWMLLFSKRKSVYSIKENKSFTFVLNFITLTLSEEQKHSDEFVKTHMLEPFMKWLKRQGALMYVWRAETQENGNIHFHITTNVFIHWKSIRKKWNKIQYSNGYTKAFTDGPNEIGVNGTDVHSVKNEKETAAYMAKYMLKDNISKKDSLPLMCPIAGDNRLYSKKCYDVAEIKNVWYYSRRAIEGRLWGCSSNLSGVTLMYTAHDYDVEEVAALLPKAEKVVKLDYAQVLCYKNLKYQNVRGKLRTGLGNLYEERREAIDSQKLLYNVDSFY